MLDEGKALVEFVEISSPRLGYPILDTTISVCPPPLSLVRHEHGTSPGFNWTGELWSNVVVLIFK